MSLVKHRPDSRQLGVPENYGNVERAILENLKRQTDEMRGMIKDLIDMVYKMSDKLNKGIVKNNSKTSLTGNNKRYKGCNTEVVKINGAVHTVLNKEGTSMKAKGHARKYGRFQNEWMTDEILKLIEIREGYYRAKRHHPCNEYLKKRHIQSRRDVRNAIRRRKQEFKSISAGMLCNSTVSSSSNNNKTVSLTNSSSSGRSSSFANRGNEIVVPASSTIPDNELKRNLAIMALLL